MRNRRVQRIPRLRIAGPHFHLGPEKRRIVEARGGYTDAGGARAFAAGEARAAVRAVAAFVLAVHLTRREMVLHGPADNLQRFRRHVDDGSISTAGDFLAVATVALEHLNFTRLRGAFVTGGSAYAPAGKGWIHCKLDKTGVANVRAETKIALPAIVRQLVGSDQPTERGENKAKEDHGFS